MDFYYFCHRGEELREDELCCGRYPLIISLNQPYFMADETCRDCPYFVDNVNS